MAHGQKEIYSVQAYTILITGATAGLGRHTTLLLAGYGHRVIATGRNETALASLRNEASTTTIETLLLDVDSMSSITEAHSEVNRLTEGRGVDVLINNAGYSQAGPISEIDDADLRAQFDTNVFGLMAVTRAFLPAMRARGSGRIINVSSVAGRITTPLLGAYHASKYAVEALSNALRLELAAFGIEVVLIEPGAIRTEFSDRAMSQVEKYRAPTSPYAVLFEDVERIRRIFSTGVIGPEVVSRTIVRAIEAERPHARYVVPTSARLVLLPFAILPTRFMDSLLRRITGLTARNLRRKPYKSS